MASNAEAQALGFSTPGGGDYIRNGDDAISQNARAAAQGLKDATANLAALQVTPDRTTFVVRSKNLFNPNDPDVMPGHSLASSGPVADASRTVTGWIPVTGGTTYTAAMATHVNVYGPDKTLLSGQRYGPGGEAAAVITFTTTVDGYARASFLTTTMATFQVEQGAAATAHAPYGVSIPELLIPEPEPEPVTTPAPGIAVPIPFAFTIPTTIKRSSSGYGAVLDLEALHDRGVGRTLYVDPVNGSNSNDGLTWDSAKADPSNAVYDAGDYGVAEVIVRGGIYTRAQTPTINGRADLIIRAEPGTRPVFTQCDTSTAWTIEGAAPVYKVSLSSTGTILDLTAPVTAGDLPVPLQPVGALAEVAATPHSTYYDAGTVYVHLHDGRAPDADVLVSRSTYHLSTPTGVGRRVLVDGCEFWAGVTSRPRAVEAGDTSLVARGCAWRFAQDNGLSVQGFARTVLVDCEATHNGVDGFNYHDFNGLTGEVLEVNCIGRLNGQTPGGSSQNGSTAHDNYRIVRVGGRYEFNPGPNVADVNHVVSANFGVYAGDALGYDGADEYDYTAPELTGSLVLVDCTSTSPLALRAPGQTVHVAGFRRAGTITGTLAPYA